MPEGAPELGAVDVTYSPVKRKTVPETLDKATARAVGVVLADNGSTDGVPERAAERPGVTLLRTGSNLGDGRAANLRSRRDCRRT